MAHAPCSLADTLAYPCSIDYGNGSVETHLGMTMRQHYAGLAMQALIGRPCDNARIPPEAEVAVDAVDYADALIKELDLEKEAP